MKTISKVIIAIIIILALIVGYFTLIPQYKNIEMSGYTFEVPAGNADVKNNTINYNTYEDKENDLNIKTWACKDVNDVNGTINAASDISRQLGENMGTNVTYNNLTLYNKSGVYTYYDADVNNSCIIIITSNNLDAIEHIFESMKKPKINVNNPFNITSLGLSVNNSEDTSDNQSAESNATIIY